MTEEEDAEGIAATVTCLDMVVGIAVAHRLLLALVVAEGKLLVEEAPRGEPCLVEG